jgi:phosphoserine phosphatase RsbU/P
LFGGQSPQGSVPLEPGDLVVLFTDGISESMNSRGEDRLIDLAKTCGDLSALEAMNRIMAAAQAFADGAQYDDMTVVILRVLVPKNNALLESTTISNDQS